MLLLYFLFLLLSCTGARGCDEYACRPTLLYLKFTCYLCCYFNHVLLKLSASLNLLAAYAALLTLLADLLHWSRGT
jgi:hypothetical protein